MSRFVVFDVETPNRMNHRMSAIGITVIEDGVLTDNFYSLINPETLCLDCLTRNYEESGNSYGFVKETYAKRLHGKMP